MKNFPIVKSRRLRSTPYTDRIESQGVSSYTVYNHMLLPSSFKSIEFDYHHLKELSDLYGKRILYLLQYAQEVLSISIQRV